MGTDTEDIDRVPETSQTPNGINAAVECFQDIFFHKTVDELAAHLDAGGDVHLRDEVEATPLLMLMRLWRFDRPERIPVLFEMASLLLASGADVNARDRVRHSVLEECSRLHKPEDQVRFANLFLNAGAEIDTGFQRDVYYASANGSDELVWCLLDRLSLKEDVLDDIFTWLFMDKKSEVLLGLVRRGHWPTQEWWKDMTHSNRALTTEMLKARPTRMAHGQGKRKRDCRGACAAGS